MVNEKGGPGFLGLGFWLGGQKAEGACPCALVGGATAALRTASREEVIVGQEGCRWHQAIGDSDGENSELRPE